MVVVVMGEENSMRANEFLLDPNVEEFLEGLTPDDVGVDEVGDYIVHYEGFTDQCQDSEEYQNNPDAVFNDVWGDFKRRMGDQDPINYGLVGSEDYPIVYSVFKNGSVSETKQRLDPKCWKGKKIGNPKTKVKGGVRVNNCVPKESIEAEEEFNLIESIIEDLAKRNQVDAEVIWEDLESLTEDELYVFAITQEPVMEDWQKVNKKDKTAGMSKKAVAAYRRENPGSKLQTAVTTDPSKLKKGSKASKRRKSYCSRSLGQKKMHNIDCTKTPDKAICKARKRWNC